jgi:pilus assembly protein CpaB
MIMLRVVILVIAIAAGSLAAWLALTMQPGVAVTTVEQSARQVPMTEVLVASTNLNQGEAVSEKGLMWQPWPESAINSGFIIRTAQPDAIKALSGSTVRSHFVSGEPIREEKLSRGSNLLSAMLPAGKRAVAIRTSVESTAGGFILPNDRVDVIQTISRPGGAPGESRLLLTNIRVLAVDQKVEDTKGQSVAMGKTATLELSPAQTEAIAAGQAVGTLSLALRSVADSNEEPMLKSEVNSVTVRILRAGQSEVVKF